MRHRISPPSPPRRAGLRRGPAAGEWPATATLRLGIDGGELCFWAVNTEGDECGLALEMGDARQLRDAVASALDGGGNTTLTEEGGTIRVELLGSDLSIKWTIASCDTFGLLFDGDSPRILLRALDFALEGNLVEMDFLNGKLRVAGPTAPGGST